MFLDHERKIESVVSTYIDDQCAAVAHIGAFEQYLGVLELRPRSVVLAP